LILRGPDAFTAMTPPIMLLRFCAERSIVHRLEGELFALPVQ
jgi:hypothetical protein